MAVLTGFLRLPPLPKRHQRAIVAQLIRTQLRVRVKDLDFVRNEILVREGKGNKDRHTMLPEILKPELQEHLEKVRRLHEKMLPPGSVPFTFQMHSIASCRTRRKNGSGSTSFLRAKCPSIRGRERSVGIMPMKGRCAARSRVP